MIASATRSGSSNAIGAPARVMPTLSVVVPAEPHPQSLPGSTPQVGFTRLAADNTAQLGQARVAVQSIDLRKNFLRRRWMPGSSPGMTTQNNDSQNLRDDASCQAIPARIGPEAFAVALRQSLELVADVDDAAPGRVVHGPAAERREAGGEDHGAVEDVLIRHNALAQAGDADVEHGKNEAVRHLLRGIGHLALLHRLPAPPFVEAPAALAAEVTHLDLVA